MAALLEKLGVVNRPEFNPQFSSDFAQEIGEEFSQDPAPNIPPAPSKSPKRAAARTSRRPSLEREVTAELEVYAQMLALTISVRDPHCGGVVSEQSKEIITAIVRILRRYPEIMAKVRSSGMVGDWLGLLMALYPVGRAIAEHHILRDDSEEDSDDDDAGNNLAAFPVYRPGTA